MSREMTRAPTASQPDRPSILAGEQRCDKSDMRDQSGSLAPVPSTSSCRTWGQQLTSEPRVALRGGAIGGLRSTNVTNLIG